MEVPSIDGVNRFLSLAVPGLLILYFRARFTTGRIPDLKYGIIIYFSVSVFYQAIFYILIPENYINNFSENRIFVLVFIFLLPSIFGTLLGLNIKFSWFEKVLDKVGIKVVHPVESAWDWRFSNCSELWVIITLKDGQVWAGLLGSRSFVSSIPSERDIFIEQVYTIDEKEKWEAKASSVLISHDQIQSIEMWEK